MEVTKTTPRFPARDRKTVEEIYKPDQIKRPKPIIRRNRNKQSDDKTKMTVEDEKPESSKEEQQCVASKSQSPKAQENESKSTTESSDPPTKEPLKRRHRRTKEQNTEADSKQSLASPSPTRKSRSKNEEISIPVASQSNAVTSSTEQSTTPVVSLIELPQPSGSNNDYNSEREVISPNPKIKFDAKTAKFSYPSMGIYKVLDSNTCKCTHEQLSKLFGRRCISPELLDLVVVFMASTLLTEAELSRVSFLPTSFYESMRIQEVRNAEIHNSNSGDSKMFEHFFPMSAVAGNLLNEKCQMRAKESGARKINFFATDVIIMIVNVADHWMLCLIVNPRNLIEVGQPEEDECTVMLFNSNSSRAPLRRSTVEWTLIQWLKAEYDNNKESFGVKGEFKTSRLVMSELRHIPIQAEWDKFNSGVYVLVFLREILENMETFLNIDKEEYENLNFNAVFPGAQQKLRNINQARRNIFERMHACFDDNTKRRVSFEGLARFAQHEE